MRKILFYGFLTCLLFSCKESKTERIAGRTLDILYVLTMWLFFAGVLR